MARNSAHAAAEITFQVLDSATSPGKPLSLVAMFVKGGIFQAAHGSLVVGFCSHRCRAPRLVLSRRHGAGSRQGAAKYRRAIMDVPHAQIGLDLLR